ncbi:hypothetical protein QP992_08840 [Corynebacterium ulcerans]|uniref:hypothetical protein n=1 Tax=Corynebacterium ulcerans TaxID=65058 RepID=UPI00254BF25B|nr:hypothetical protein [Corynebacterium ulcerans]MDK8889249.1 hypothetical protein [Corynebacterium ulcerans]
MIEFASLRDVQNGVPAELWPDYGDETLKRLLRIATSRVRHATRRAMYAVTPNGLPADDDLRDALRDATVAQVYAFLEWGLAEAVITGGMGVEAAVSTASINGASVTLDESAMLDGRKHLLDGGLSEMAETYLEEAGLLHGLPGVIYG